MSDDSLLPRRNGKARLSSPNADLKREMHEAHRRFISADGLSGACVPGSNRSFEFQAGYRIRPYRDEQFPKGLVELEGAIPSKLLCPIFFECVQLLEAVVDVVIECGHHCSEKDWNGVDPFPFELYLGELIHKEPLMRILKSQYRSLMFDGKCGISVFSSEAAGYPDPTEVRLRDDKILYIITDDLQPYIDILEASCIAHDQNVKFVSDGAHVHYSSKSLEYRTDRMIEELGAVSNFE